ncbi:hypothetical protein [Pseudomonas putida]|uniref:hypothetical protein n=1 Tax=Pseudomonas putida TaxID=303 RepID=UPI0035A4495F
MRTTGAYLAAHRGRIAHFDCVTIVREALRELGQVSSTISQTADTEATLALAETVLHSLLYRQNCQDRNRLGTLSGLK